MIRDNQIIEFSAWKETTVYDEADMPFEFRKDTDDLGQFFLDDTPLAGRQQTT